MMKYLILLLINSLFISSCSQVKTIREYYNNGKVRCSGKIFTYSTANKKIYCRGISRISKKIEQWVYYYENGTIKQIENYKNIKDCNVNGTRDGKWQYWDEKGRLVNEVIYKDDILFEADVSDIYMNDELVGKLRIRKGLSDTIFFKNCDSDSINLVKNNSFELYKGQPNLVYRNGQEQIEKYIPYWSTPNKNTPDYYNQYNKLVKVPDNIPVEISSPQYNYVGIILYHDPLLSYSEYITGDLKQPLQANKDYCLKIHIILSQNSGFFINKLGAFFSSKTPAIPNTQKQQKNIPQILFSRDLDNRDNWIVLCDSFTAKGNERYITLGRYCGINETNIKKINPINRSEGGFNGSAYYLIDKIELYENKNNNCLCEPTKEKPKPIKKMIVDFDSVRIEDSLNIDLNKIFVLHNINFEFDRSILLPSSMLELEKLRHFLLLNNTIHIMLMGHTDNLGTDDYNYRLSLSRAAAVFDWLVKHDIKSERIKFEGYGAKKPIVNNSSVENRLKNRRVEFKITEK